MFAARRSALLVLILTWATAPVSARAGPPASGDDNLAESMAACRRWITLAVHQQRARLNLAQTRLAQAAWRAEQVRGLREDGLATMYDYRVALCAHKTALAELNAWQQFDTMLARLKQQWPADWPDTDSPTPYDFVRQRCRDGYVLQWSPRLAAVASSRQALEDDQPPPTGGELTEAERHDLQLSRTVASAEWDYERLRHCRVAPGVARVPPAPATEVYVPVQLRRITLRFALSLIEQRLEDETEAQLAESEYRWQKDLLARADLLHEAGLCDDRQWLETVADTRVAAGRVAGVQAARQQLQQLRQALQRAYDEIAPVDSIRPPEVDPERSLWGQPEFVQALFEAHQQTCVCLARVSRARYELELYQWYRASTGDGKSALPQVDSAPPADLEQRQAETLCHQAELKLAAARHQHRLAHLLMGQLISYAKLDLPACDYCLGGTALWVLPAQLLASAGQPDDRLERARAQLWLEQQLLERLAAGNAAQPLIAAALQAQQLRTLRAAEQVAQVRDAVQLAEAARKPLWMLVRHLPATGEIPPGRVPTRFTSRASGR